MLRTAIFRADASALVGFGHVMRCLTLADRLASIGVDCVFFSRSLPFPLVERVHLSGHQHVPLADDEDPELEMRDIRRYIETVGVVPVALVCDHYHRGKAWEDRLKDCVDIIVVIDDLANRSHTCDLLIDPSVNRKADDYRSLVPEFARVLTGTRYALLRQEFGRLRSGQRTIAANAARRPGRVVISLGGSDQPNVTGFVLSALAGLQDSFHDGLHVDAIIGGGCQHVADLRNQISALPFPVDLHVNTSEMARILSGADLAFGASGGSSWERCCLGIPAITLVLAGNQRYIAEQLAALGATLNLGEWPNIALSDVQAAFRLLWKSPDILATMRTVARGICDGEGARRVAEALLDFRARSGGQITLRPMRTEDALTLFDFQTVPGARNFARNPNPPNWDEHRAWFSRRLLAATQPFYMVEVGGAPAGMVRLDQRETKANEFEVSILIAPNRHRQGLGLAALRLLRLRHPDISTFANVNPHNTASLSIFRKAGYENFSNDWHQLRSYNPAASK